MSDFRTLIQAAQDGNLELLESILKRDQAFVLRRDDSGATALHYAALNGHRRAAELSVYGANVNSRDAQFGATPAGWTIEHLRILGGFLANRRSCLRNRHWRPTLGQALVDTLPCPCVQAGTQWHTVHTSRPRARESGNHSNVHKRKRVRGVSVRDGLKISLRRTDPGARRFWLPLPATRFLGVEDKRQFRVMPTRPTSETSYKLGSNTNPPPNAVREQSANGQDRCQT